MNIGDYAFELSSEEHDPWQIMMDKERLLEIMDEEQQREYGQYPNENKENKELDQRKKKEWSQKQQSHPGRWFRIQTIRKIFAIFWNSFRTVHMRFRQNLNSSSSNATISKQFTYPVLISPTKTAL